jgi:hypothetical protein
MGRPAKDARMVIGAVFIKHKHKAWLFSDTPAGARASATHYSLIETAKANGLEPYDYLKQVLTALPYAESVEEIEALLPWNFKKTETTK